MFNKLILNPLLNSIHNFSNNDAFCINESVFTYKEFGQYISKIRYKIQNLDKGLNYFGLVVNDDIETYASIFALWLEGKSYVPLHPKQPIERNIEIITQMDIEFILESNDKSTYSDYSIIHLKKLVFFESFLTLSDDIDDDGLAYILFTSGSTGRPKGVPITRNNLALFMDSFWETGIQIDENDKCLQTFDLTFDVSIQSFLVPLTKGACVYTVPHDQIKYSYVYGLLEDHNITFGAMAPTMLRYLKPYFGEINLPMMKKCIVTAEASPIELIIGWQNCVQNATIYNFYGPTEATIYCTFSVVNKIGFKTKSLNGMLTIGKPMKNVEAIVVDQDKNILGKGEKGELCLSGGQITPGYFNDSKNNTNSFFRQEYKGRKHRFYQTGDLCYYDEDGDLMLFGRLDSQVKIQGYRIELGEIEYHSRIYLKNTNCLVMSFLNNSKNNEIAIFIESKDLNSSKLISYLKSKLPLYMIPSKVICISSFPVNKSDKIDKQKLRLKLG